MTPNLDELTAAALAEPTPIEPGVDDDYQRLVQEANELTGIPVDKLTLLGPELINLLLKNVAAKIEQSTARRSVTLMSMVPWDLISDPFTHNGQVIVYSIPAAVDFTPQYLRLYDSTTIIMDTHHDDENSPPGYEMRPVPAPVIAENLVRHWTGDHFANSSGHNIGVMQISGKTGTKEEIQRCYNTQRDFFAYMIEHASKLDMRDSTRKLIGMDHHRAMRELLKYPNIKIDLDRYKWARLGTETQDAKKCVWCAGKINMEAVFCPLCRSNQAEYYIMTGEVPPDSDMRVLQVWEKIREAQKAAGSTKPPILVSTASVPVLNPESILPSNIPPIPSSSERAEAGRGKRA